MKYTSLIFRERPPIYRFVDPAQLVFALCVLCALCGYSPAQDFKQLHPGVEYAQVEHKLGNDPVKINLLRLDLTEVRLDVHHALDKAIGLETTSSIAQRKNAVAAINAGFFRLDKSEFAGDNVGFLLVDKYLWSEPTYDRAAVGFLNSKRTTEVTIDRWTFSGYLRWKGKDHSGLLHGFNRQVRKNEVVALTPVFGDASKFVAEKQLIVRQKRVVGYCDVGCEIPVDGFILAGNGTGAAFLSQLKVRDRIEFVWDTEPEDRVWPPFRLEDAVAGVPQLIKNGKIEITWEQEKASKSFVETRHPRTAVAKLKDGKFLMMTVDGRQPGVSVGMSLQELAEYLHSLGAVDAMNLDGGGSTTMFLDGKVVNKPSDPTGERKIGDAIVVTLRKKPAAKK